VSSPPRPRAAVVAAPAYRPPLEGRRGKLRLDFNERTEAAPEAAMAALRALDPEAVAAYPEYGPYVTRLAAALGVAEDEVLPTNATDEAIQVAIATYVDPGERVLLAAPTFAMFAVYARIAGAEPVEVPFAGPSLDFPEAAYLAALADPRVRLAVLVDPNNPTGTDLPPGLIERVCAARPDVAVLVDEAYGAFTGRTAVPLIARHANLIVSQTFSKAHGLAGLRIGHLVSRAENVAALAKVRSPYSVNVAAMAAAAALLGAGDEPGGYAARARAGRRRLEDGLARRGIPVVRAGANFVLARFGGEHAALVSALRARGVLVRDRSGDRGLEGCVRITAGGAGEVERFFAALDETFRTRALLLDLDGTLVDVSRSYIACDREVAAHFLAESGIAAVVTDADVHALKHRGGGTNDDWTLTARLIAEKAREAGRALEVPLERIVPIYQERYLGRLAATERWLAPRALLERLGRRFRLGIVTGRPREEAALALGLPGAAGDLFEAVVAREDTFPRLKPDPAGIDRALGALGCGREGSIYVGDGPDDMRAARAAGIEAVGCIGPGDDPERARRALREAGAEVVIDGIHELERIVF
jgi:histidinol-phosphate aminotransferase